MRALVENVDVLVWNKLLPLPSLAAEMFPVIHLLSPCNLHYAEPDSFVAIPYSPQLSKYHLHQMVFLLFHPFCDLYHLELNPSLQPLMMLNLQSVLFPFIYNVATILPM